MLTILEPSASHNLFAIITSKIYDHKNPNKYNSDKVWNIMRNTKMWQACSKSNSLQTHGLYSARPLCLWNSPGKNIGVVCHFLLQESLPTQGSNPCLLCLLHWQEDFFLFLTTVPPAMQETWIGSLSWEDLLEKGMATHSNILAWRIPWTEEAGGLYSPWSQKESDTTQWLTLSFLSPKVISVGQAERWF